MLPVFKHLGARRRYEQGVPLPILDSEVEAFCRLRGLVLRPQDLEALERLDCAWLLAMREPAYDGAAEEGSG